MKRIITGVLLLAGISGASAQQNYNVSLIPKELLSHANSVVRNDKTDIEIEGTGSYTMRVSHVVTILNKNGDDKASLELPYDKDNVLKSVKGIVYNDFGKPSEKFSESDFADAGLADGFSLFNSERIKSYQPAIARYPYTVEYDYEFRSKQTLFFDSWEPMTEFGESVEQSTFNIINTNKDFPIRYKERNIKYGDITKTASPKDGSISWSAKNLKAINYEPFSPPDYLPRVQIASEKFSFYGMNGSYQSWQDLGKWIYDKLVSPRQELPEETIERIKDLTKDIADPKLKAKKVYEYVQQKTHYISVQAGVGGWQPFLASDVDQQNYGDCKALVNYTQALLKAINIDSYYCVVNAGDDNKISMPADFPNMEGNHIILCIPFKNDTTWADCTSQTIPFGYLGAFTDDRTVLACNPEGGKLLHTPKYNAQDNQVNRKAEFTITADGELTGSMNTNYGGVYYEERDELVNEAFSEQNKMLQHIYPINNMTVTHYELKQDKGFDPVTTENIKLTAKDYATLTDGKYYFLANPVVRSGDIPAQVTNRQTDVNIVRGYSAVDEITYTLPAGYKLKKGTLNISLSKPFGSFSVSMQLNGNQLTYKRQVKWIGGTYNKDTYQDLFDFCQDIADADDYTVILTCLAIEN